MFWTLEALKDPVFLLGPSWWHSTEEATQGALSSNLTDTKRRTKGVIPGLSLGPFLQSVQTLTPGSSVAMWTWSLGSKKRGVGLWVVFLCILKPLSGEAQQRAKYPLSQGNATLWTLVWRTPRLCCNVVRFQSLWWVSCRSMPRCFVLVLNATLTFLRQGHKTCWPVRVQKEQWFSPNHGCA